MEDIDNYISGLKDIHSEVIDKEVSKKVNIIKFISWELAQYFATTVEFKSALRWASVALKYFQALPLSPVELPTIKLLLAAIRGELGQVQEAILLATEALGSTQQNNHLLQRGFALLTYLYVKNNDPLESRACYNKFEELFRKQTESGSELPSFETIISWGPQPILSIYLESLGLLFPEFLERLKLSKNNSSRLTSTTFEGVRSTNIKCLRLIRDSKYQEARSILLKNHQLLKKGEKSHLDEDEISWGHEYTYCLYLLGMTHKGEGYKLKKGIRSVSSFRDAINHFNKAVAYFIRAANWIAKTEERRLEFFNLRMELFIELGFSYKENQRYEKAIQVLELVRKATKLKSDETSKKNNIRSKGVIGLIFYEQNNISEAIKYFEETLMQAEKIEDVEYIALMYRHLGYCYLQLGDKKTANSHFTKAADSFKTTGMEQHFRHMDLVSHATEELPEDEED